MPNPNNVPVRIFILPDINDTSNELIPEDALLHNEEALDTLEQFDVKEERLVEEFEYFMLLRDMTCGLCCADFSEGCCRKM